MRKKDKYKLIKHAIKEYSETFNIEYVPSSISKNRLLELLYKSKKSYMAEWSYCCNGLYSCCWQEPFLAGNWGMTQEKVNEIIEMTIKETTKACRRDKRIALCENDGNIHVLIVARDLPSIRRDYLICITDKEW